MKWMATCVRMGVRDRQRLSRYSNGLERDGRDQKVNDENDTSEPGGSKEVGTRVGRANPGKHLDGVRRQSREDKSNDAAQRAQSERGKEKGEEPNECADDYRWLNECVRYVRQ
ncbi:hypothetical protein C8Q70DRAFT_141342 [Cubamyces menziesii]|nr:hypothetical protein C8Q70DRAFT_141342 [Cubamyces menziesii]